MVGYVLMYSDCGDITIDSSEGTFRDAKKAYERQVELNREALEEHESEIYEDGYGEDYYPSSDELLAHLEEIEDWDAYEKELDKHLLTDVYAICDKLNNEDADDWMPDGFYRIVTIAIHG